MGKWGSNKNKANNYEPWHPYDTVIAEEVQDSEEISTQEEEMLEDREETISNS